MYKTTVKNTKGEDLRLFPNKSYAVEIEGLTPPKAALNFANVGTLDGSVYNSGRIENRNIVLAIKPLVDVEKNRINLYRFFRVKQQVFFYFENGMRNVYIEGIVESIDGSLFEQSQTIQVSIICPNPMFKDIEEDITDISQVVPTFTFPFAIAKEGVQFSYIDKVTEKNVFYNGEIDAGIIIELTAVGAVKDPTLYKENGGSIGIDIDMQLGDVITINTNKGEKSVTLLRDATETNIINLVRPKPTWFTLEPGDNVFLYTATNQELLQIVFKTRPLYEGV